MELISRQQAIDALSAMYDAAEDWCREAKTDVIKARAESCMASIIEMKMKILKLPPIQPEIVRCKDCKNYKFGMCLYSMTSGVGKLPNGFCDWAKRREVTT